MKKIRAIETHYKGYRFRSRLEARWAVVFDKLGLEWEYEPEGFVLEDGQRYLPDFYFTDSKWFLEIKSTKSHPSLDKARVLDNNPPEYAFGCLVLTSDNLNPDDVRDQRYAYNRVCDKLWDAKQIGDTINQNKYGSELIDITNNYNNSPYLTLTTLGAKKEFGAIENALRYARSARFEFGETPKKY